MTEETIVLKDSNWTKLLRRHWEIFTAFIISSCLAFAGAVYVFLWFTGNAQATGLVPPV